MRFVKYWLPVMVWMMVIFTASTERGAPKNTEAMVRPPVQFINPTVTEPQLRQINFDVRKAAHFVEYTILAFLLWRAFRAQPGLAQFCAPAQIALVLLVCAAYAGLDEWHQHFVRSRTASCWDVLLDTSGAVFGILVFYLLERWRSKKRSQ